jgi:uncharacterized protein YdeI (YjbR/CyaY-like superfamily)
MPLQPTFFASPSAFRRWLAKHHDTSTELWVGYHKKGSGKPSMTWPESVDEALCYGWIDGIRKSVDEERYTIRFTPRKRSSIWSAVNIGRARALVEEGRMCPAGLAAFEVRRADRSAVYAFEQRATPTLAPAMEKQFRRNAKAWRFFERQPPGYRRLALWWVVSAKREETRAKRLATLIADSAAGRRIGALAPRPASRP